MRRKTGGISRTPTGWKVRGTNLDGSKISKTFAAEEAAVGRHVRFHDLRHTCASLLVSGAWGRAWSLEEVKQLLGHSSISVTERYAHFAGSLLDDAAAQTDAIKVSRKCPKLQNTRKRIHHGSN